MNETLRFSGLARALLPLLAALTLASAAVQAQEEIYKWVDEEGVTHYSARPPEGVEYQRVSTTSNQVSTVAPQTVRDTENLGDEGDTRVRGNLPDLPQIEVQEPDPELVAERCDQARDNMMWLTARTGMLTRDEDGTERRMDEEERQALIEQTQAFLDEWC